MRELSVAGGRMTGVTESTPQARRASLTLALTLAAMSVFGPFSIDTPFPAFKSMAAQLAVSDAAMQQLVSTYLLSFALMSIFHGPISDAVGRKPVVIAGASVYALASIGCAVSPSFGMLLVFRALQGMSAGAGMIIGRAVIQDLFTGAEAQRQMSMVSMIFGVAPAVAPVLGGALLSIGPWQGIFWFLSLWGAFVAILVALTLPESHPAEKRTPLRVRPLLEGLAACGMNGAFQRLAIAMMLMFAGQFLYIAGAAIIVRDRLGLGEQDFWVLFLPLITGIMTGAWVQNRLAPRVRGRYLAAAGFVVALASALVNLLLVELPATSGVLPWAVLPLGGIAFGVQLSFPILTVTMLELFPQRRGSAASMQAFEQLLLNAVVAGVVVPLVAGSLTSLALTSLAFVLAGGLMGGWHALTMRVRRGPTDAENYLPNADL